MLNKQEQEKLKQLLKEGKSHSEIAGILKCGTATVARYASRFKGEEAEIGQLKNEIAELKQQLKDVEETICYYIDEKLTAKATKPPMNSEYLSNEFRAKSEEETPIKEKLLGGWKGELAKEKTYADSLKGWFAMPPYPPLG